MGDAGVHILASFCLNDFDRLNLLAGQGKILRRGRRNRSCFFLARFGRLFCNRVLRSVGGRRCCFDRFDGGRVLCGGSAVALLRLVRFRFLSFGHLKFDD